MPVPLSIHEVSKAFGALRALDAVSVDIAAGELFFLLGPSGCGKTTLLRGIAGFCEPDAGTIRLGERDITRLPPHRRDTGMVFQSYALWPHLTVRRNVAFGLDMRAVPPAEAARRVEEVLALVRMSEKAEAKPNELSGGQQQRVALARALVVQPQCLLLDEPLSNLDAKLRLEMRTEIRRLCKDRGLTAVYVTHDQKEALSIADRLAVLNHGRIEQVGAPRDVYLNPASRFVAGFIGETNFLAGRAAGVGRNGAIEVDTPLGRLAGRVSGPAVSAGDAVTVSIRPETIRLNPDADVTVNRLSGQLHDTVYLGEVAQHRLRVDAPNGAVQELDVFDLNPRMVALGEPLPVTFAIAPSDVVLLKD